MATMIEYDLKEILAKEFGELNRQLSEIRNQAKEDNEKINNKLDKITEDITSLKLGQVRLEGEIKALDEKLTGEIKTLDEKVDGLAKRIDNQEFVSRGVLIGLIVAILGAFAKFGFFPNP